MVKTVDFNYRPCRVGGSNPIMDKIFCNIHLFRVPLSWTGSVQMKSSMTINRGNRCIERERCFKNGRDMAEISLNRRKSSKNQKPTNQRSKTFKGARTSFKQPISRTRPHRGKHLATKQLVEPTICQSRDAK